jgi:hypothetical protein
MNNAERSTVGPETNQQRGQSRWVLLIGAGLFLCVGLLVLTGLNFAVQRRQYAAAILAQPQIEQRALQYVQSYSPGTVTQVSVQPATLGQVMGPLNCSLPERALRVGLILMALETYDPCDPNTPLWKVDLQGTFSFNAPNGPHTASSVEVIYDEAGRFIRAGSGPLTPDP